MCTLPKKPVMKVVYEDDIRLWRSPAVDQYLALQEFVKSTFDLRVFYLQFMDDEQDRITIASQLDLEHAVDFAAAENLKSLKILVSKGCLHRVPLETSDGNVLCFCGAQFEQMGTGNAYSQGCSVFCDGCNRECGKSSQVYHCVGNRNNLHPHGYDLCPDCYASHVPPPPPPKKEVIPEETSAEVEAVAEEEEVEVEMEMDVFAPVEEPAVVGEEEVVSDDDEYVPQSSSSSVEIVGGPSVIEIFEYDDDEDEDEDEEDEEDEGDEEEVSISVEMDMELEEFDMDEKDSNVIFAPEKEEESSPLFNLMKIANLEIMAEVNAEEQEEESSTAVPVVVEAEEEEEEEEEVEPFEFEPELNLILEMGFTDVVSIQEMLIKYHGSVPRVMMEL